MFVACLLCCASLCPWLWYVVLRVMLVGVCVCCSCCCVYVVCDLFVVVVWCLLLMYVFFVGLGACVVLMCVVASLVFVGELG